MFTDVFIRRPRLAMVIAILITLAGLIAIRVIPVSQYPDIAPPTVQVSANYPGADATTVEEAVALAIESQITGVEGMRYMRSTSNNAGQYSLSVSFDLGVDPDIAAVNVQNRVKLAEPRLPQAVRDQGLKIIKASTDILQVISFYSDNPEHDQGFLSNFVSLNIVDELKRINGVGDVYNFGLRDYAMRVWLDPKKLEALSLSAEEVISALRSQHLQAAAGRIGAEPVLDNKTELQMTIAVKGRLTDAKEFENIIVRTTPDGSKIRIKDIARVELGSQFYDIIARQGAGPASPMAVYLSPGANAVQVAKDVAAKLDQLQSRFPSGVHYKFIFNTSEFVLAMMEKVVHTLIEAFVLVGIVVFVFLGRLRPTIIPLVAVPVSVIGAFGVLLMMGYSANTISLLAMVLAIGIVVDDAIVVVENVEKVMEEEPELSPTEATRKAMGEIVAPIIAITLVLLAVFVPVAFLPGTSGVLFRQFAVTISAAMVISAIIALTLTPALCGLILRPGEPVGFMKTISNGINSVARGYGNVVKRLTRVAILGLVLVGLFLFATMQIGSKTPSGFLPAEDKGFVMGILQLPSGASLNRTYEVMEQGRKIIEADPAVESVAAITGFDLLGGGLGSNAGVAFIRLKDFAERTDPSMHSTAVVGRLTKELQQLTDGIFMTLNPPAIPGIGTTGGFEMMVEALQGQTPPEMAAAMRGIIMAANQNPKLAAVYSTFDANTPQIRLNIDREKVYSLGLTLPQVFNALSANLAAAYISDLTLFGKSYSVWLQADAQYRNDLSAIYDIPVVNASGEVVRFRAFASAAIEPSARTLVRYNNYRAVSINGTPAPGIGDGEAIAQMEDVAKQTLPAGFSFEWTGQALEVIASAGQTVIVLGFAVLFAYLFLVALYESWIIPAAVMLSVSSAVVSAIGGIYLAGASIDVYAQIGIVVLIALAAKNAILIVEFALARLAEGHPPAEAAYLGAQERFRPVMMTSFAFIAGLVPLVRAQGPGADSMYAVGLPVICGMLGSSIIGIFIIPLLFVLFEKLREMTKPKGGKGKGDKVEAPSSEGTSA